MTPAVRVLIVDDMPHVRRELTQLLDLAGGLEIVGHAANGAQAVELAQTLCPDVVLLDLGMPVMDGFEAARRIKASGSGSRIVVLSVRADEATRREAAQAGANAFVVKGSSLDTLLEAIVGRAAGVRSAPGGHS
ncbi:MAG TPA: response regulator transcription factor [Anaerolineales bacterium]